MSIDVLQEKIRKTKNPSMIDLALRVSDLPAHLLEEEGSACAAYGRFCRELIGQLKGLVPAVRVSFTAFAILGPDGLRELQSVLSAASSAGYYVALEAPYILSPMMAQATAEAVWGKNAIYPCDGLIVSAYAGSDVIKQFIPYVKDQKKDLFPVVRTSNKTAPEIQDLMTGSRLVHAAAADLINRFGADFVKLFPITNLGVEYVKAVKAPLSHIKLLGVGGINEKNINDYLLAGLSGIGIGANIANNKLIAENAFTEITKLAKFFTEGIKK